MSDSLGGATTDDSPDDRLDAVGRRLRNVVAGSRLVAGARRRADEAATALAESRPVRALDRATETLGRWAADSWLFGPPGEPEVIVIDLRETYTVGPLIAALDRAAAWVGPRWRGSTPERALDRIAAAVADAPIRAVAAVVVGAALARLAVGLVVGEPPSGPLLVALGLGIVASRERRTAAELRETAVGRAVEALLVPPEPPADRPDADGSEESRPSDAD